MLFFLFFFILFNNIYSQECKNLIDYSKYNLDFYKNKMVLDKSNAIVNVNYG